MRTYFAFLRVEARWLAFGLLLCFISSLGQTFFVSLFAAEIRSELDLGHAAFATYYSIGTIASGLIVFWAGRSVDHLSLHLVTGATLLGLCVAGAALASAPGPVLLTLAFFLLRLCGQGMSTHIAMTCMARWFARNRGKAISIAGLGQPLGEAVLPPLVIATLAIAGWRESWWLFTSVVAVVLVPLTLALVWKGERTPRSVDDTPAPDQRRSWTRPEVLRDKRFWLTMPAIVGPAWIFTGVFFHQVAIVTGKGWDFGTFATTYVAYALIKVATALVAGVLIDRWSAATLAPWTMPVLSLSLVVLALADHPLAAWVFMILMGIHMGLHMATSSALWPELYGRRHLGAIKALVMSLGVLASALGPPLFGWVLDTGSGPAGLLLACAAYGLIAAFLMRMAVAGQSECDPERAGV